MGTIFLVNTVAIPRIAILGGVTAFALMWAGACKGELAEPKTKDQSAPPSTAKKSDLACEAGTSKRRETTDGELEEFCVLPDGRRHGPYRMTDDLGGENTGFYKKGDKDGHWRFLDEGTPLLTTDYDAACGEECENGKRTNYTDDGKPSIERAMNQGTQHGWSLAFDEAGKVTGASCFEAGRQVLKEAGTGSRPTGACPLDVDFEAPSGRVLFAHQSFDEEHDAVLLKFSIGEVTQPGKRSSTVKSESGEHFKARNAFMIPLSTKTKPTLGSFVLTHHPEHGGIIGTVTKISKRSATVYRHSGLGQGVMSTSVNVPLADIVPVRQDLGPGSGVIAGLGNEPRMGTVIGKYGDLLAAELDGALVVMATGAYRAVPVASTFDEGSTVYFKHLSGLTEGTVMSVDNTVASVSVEFDFAGSPMTTDTPIARLISKELAQADPLSE